MIPYYEIIILSIYDGCYYFEIAFDDEIYRWSDSVFDQYPEDIKKLMNYISDNYYIIGKGVNGDYIDYINKHYDYKKLYEIDNGSIIIHTKEEK